MRPLVKYWYVLYRSAQLQAWCDCGSFTQAHDVDGGDAGDRKSCMTPRVPSETWQ